MRMANGGFDFRNIWFQNLVKMRVHFLEREGVLPCPQSTLAWLLKVICVLSIYLQSPSTRHPCLWRSGSAKDISRMLPAKPMTVTGLD